MWNQDSHLSDQQILLDLDGELSARDARKIRSHLDSCWMCRARRQELENTIEGYVRIHREELGADLPPGAAARALLKARLVQPVTDLNRRTGRYMFYRGFTWASAAAAAFGVLAFGILLVRSNAGRQSPSAPHALIVSIPDPRLTPGAALLVSRRAVCEQANPNNKAVPIALQRKVFEEYGITGAEPRAYEVDYLVTPALGGADDIHNLWPHSYEATVWNARVKDALEARLRDMVCDGSLDLREAQEEISENWIAAYRKYFHTDKPLPEHEPGVH